MSFDKDRCWLNQFKRLLALERDDRNPRFLDTRWLLLASRTWGDKRWAVRFDVPDRIYHILDDTDVRSRDRNYAENQWRLASEWLNG